MLGMTGAALLEGTDEAIYSAEACWNSPLGNYCQHKGCLAQPAGRVHADSFPVPFRPGKRSAPE